MGNFRRVKPAFFPAPVEDAIRAMRIIRGHAGSWHITPSCIAACGFSAGGHLAAYMGTSIAQGIPAQAGDGYDRYDYVPNYLLLSYSVLSFTQNRNPGCADNLLGKERANQEKLSFSPDQCVTRHTPPAFIWHTLTDQTVDYNSSILFAQAMAPCQRPLRNCISFPAATTGCCWGGTLLTSPSGQLWPSALSPPRKSSRRNWRHATPIHISAGPKCASPGRENTSSGCLRRLDQQQNGRRHQQSYTPAFRWVPELNNQAGQFAGAAAKQAGRGSCGH